MEKTNKTFKGSVKVKSWSIRFSLFLCFLFAFLILAAGESQGAPNAKNIILLVADGWGAKHIEATNQYTGTDPFYQVSPAWTPYWMSTFPNGGSYDTVLAWSDFNYVLQGAVTDSAAAATALYTGNKTNNGRISVSHDAVDRLFSIGEIAKTIGKAVGAVSSVPVSHATPGAWASHNDDRNNAYAISDEAFFEDPNTTGLPTDDIKYSGGYGPTSPSIDVLIGDGREGFVNTAIKNKLAIESGLLGKHTLVERLFGQNGGVNLINAASDPGTTKLAGLFDQIYRNADGSGFNDENPTLSDSTYAALTVLNRNPNGFVLMVEGGAVDWAAHANNLDQMIGEQIDFNEAVQTVIDWVEDPNNGSSWADTLVIVTGDHECGYLTADVNTLPNVPLGTINDTTLPLEKIYLGSGGRRASWDDMDSNDVIDGGETVYWAWNSGGHTNSLIPLYTRGPGADLFADFIVGNDTVRGDYFDNTDVFGVMSSVLSGGGFETYNDLAWAAGQIDTDITTITSPNGGSGLPSSGELLNFASGNPSGITLTITGGEFNGGDHATIFSGTPAPGTDAYSIFNGKLTALGSLSYEDLLPPPGDDIPLVLTFSGMDPNETYELAFYGHRDNYEWDRASLVTISGADAFNNQSSAATDNPEAGSGGAIYSGPSDNSTRLPSDNDNGYVARFTDINPGTDGEAVLTISWDGTPGFEYRGKYANALMLKQENFNPPPTLSITEPDGTADTVVVGDTYTITYSLNDPNDVVTGSFFYDTDNTGLDGTALTGACASAAEGVMVTCSWDTTGVVPGSYYVYGLADDGSGPVSAYSSGTLTINATNTPPILSITEPDGNGDTVLVGDAYTIIYSLDDPDDVVIAAFYYDVDGSGLDGTALTGACANAAEGSGMTCNWDTTGMVPGSYFVYGITDDGSGPVSAYSSGILTINALNVPPTLSVSEPDGISDTVVVGDTYNISYTLDDSDDVVTAAFYYDTDNTGLDGTPLTGACANAAEGSGVMCSWDTVGMTPGSYYVYGQADDGSGPVSAYSSGTLTINATNTLPTLSISEPDGTSDTVVVGDPYFITYSLDDPDDVVTASFHYDTDNTGFDGTALTGACETAVEGAGVTCSWDTTGMVPGSYFVYGLTFDGSGLVRAYSSGTLTINATNTLPTLSVSEPDGTSDTVVVGDPYFITYSLDDPDDVVTASFHYDTDNTGFDGTALTGACATAAEGSGVTCSWDTTGMTPGSYYVYGLTFDGSGLVRAYSSGTLTINAPPNVPPTLSISEPDGTSDTVVVGDPYDITYTLDDSDDVVTAAFYYDDNDTGLDGTALNGACAAAAEGTNATCSWDTTGMTPGNYFVYGKTNDGSGEVSAYSIGQLTINTPNTPPTLSIAEPDGTTDTVVVGDAYLITYSLDDPDDVVTAAFYYDTDNTGLDGTPLTGACANAAEGSGVTCSWDTTGMTTGSYYVYGQADDGSGPVSAYSSGMLTINTPNTSPTLSIVEPDGTTDTVVVGDAYLITYNLDDPDDVVTAAFYYDDNNTGLDGTALTGACAAAAEGTNATCSWDTTGMTPGSYFVYGETNDGSGLVSAYSTGQLTINASEIPLQSGVPQAGSVLLNEWKYYSITSSATDEEIEVALTNISTDVDLYVRAGSKPDLANFDCRPYVGGSFDETCVLPNTGVTTWYIGVQGWQAGNYTVTATLIGLQELQSGVPQADSVSLNQWKYYSITTSPTDTQIEVAVTNISTDVDLYVRAGSKPDLANYDCRPYVFGSGPETCTLPNTGVTTWYIGVQGWEAGTYTVTATLISQSPVAPTIVSVPVTSGTVGQLYSYDVNATGTPTPTYALLTPPAGMTIDSATGLIQWTPSAEGDVSVEVEASNGELPNDTQPFTISVVPAGGDIPLQSGVPQVGSVLLNDWKYYVITSSAADTEIAVALTNISTDVDLYVRAGSKPDLDNYDCRPYVDGSNPETCTLPSTGVTTWYIGVHGYRAGSYTVTATLMSPTPVAPTIVSVPVTAGTVGQLYSYDVNATGTPAPTYTLLTSPAGMTIDSATGLIQWTPSAEGDVPVEVEASNGELPNDTQPFTISVFPSGGETPLQSGVPQAGSVLLNEWKYYVITSSAADTELQVALTNISTDVDLYVRAGSKPDLANYDCRPYIGGNVSETCTLPNTGATTWYIGVQGWQAGSYTVTATLTGPVPLQSGVPQADSVLLNKWKYYIITSSPTDTQIEVAVTNISTDVDLYVRAGTKPDLTNYDCRPYVDGSAPETCTLPNTGATTWYIGVRGYRAGSYTVTATMF